MTRTASEARQIVFEARARIIKDAGAACGETVYLRV
jgi:hypothetical protein